MSNFLKQIFSRSLPITKHFMNLNQTTNSIHTTSQTLIKISYPVCAEPTKAKKRIDPAILMLRYLKFLRIIKLPTLRSNRNNFSKEKIVKKSDLKKKLKNWRDLAESWSQLKNQSQIVLFLKKQSINNFNSFHQQTRSLVYNLKIKNKSKKTIC